MGRFIEIIEEDEEIRYDHPGTENGVVYVRRLAADAANRIQRSYQKIDWRGNQRHVYVPEGKALELEMDLWDHMVRRWDGVKFKDGKDVPCTREWKYRLPQSVRTGILAICDEANVSGLRTVETDAPNPTKP